MEKETKNLMDKLKGYENSLKGFETNYKKQVSILLKAKNTNALPEQMQLSATQEAISTLYTFVPEIKDYQETK